MIAAAVDPSLLRDQEPRVDAAYSILDEMIGRGNRIAEYHRYELEQLDLNMQKLLPLQQPIILADSRAQSDTTPISTEYQDVDVQRTGIHARTESSTASIDTILSEWNSEDGFSGEQLMAVADSLDFNQLDWLVTGNISQPFGVNFE